MTERRPERGAGEWVEHPCPAALHLLNPTAASFWKCGPVSVTSTLSNMERPSSTPGPTWLITITRRGKRPRPCDVRKALRAFGMQEAEEDNHGPGNGRSYFLVVDKALRGVCECKTSEASYTDEDGYAFTCAEDPAECGGCNLEPITGRPCPRHGVEQSPSENPAPAAAPHVSRAP